jgi:hypothetical protein
VTGARHLNLVATRPDRGHADGAVGGGGAEDAPLGAWHPEAEVAAGARRTIGGADHDPATDPRHRRDLDDQAVDRLAEPEQHAVGGLAVPAIALGDRLPPPGRQAVEAEPPGLVGPGPAAAGAVGPVAAGLDHGARHRSTIAGGDDHAGEARLRRQVDRDLARRRRGVDRARRVAVGAGAERDLARLGPQREAAGGVGHRADVIAAEPAAERDRDDRPRDRAAAHVLDHPRHLDAARGQHQIDAGPGLAGRQPQVVVVVGRMAPARRPEPRRRRGHRVGRGEELFEAIGTGPVSRDASRRPGVVVDDVLAVRRGAHARAGDRRARGIAHGAGDRGAGLAVRRAGRGHLQRRRRRGGRRAGHRSRWRRSAAAPPPPERHDRGDEQPEDDDGPLRHEHLAACAARGRIAPAA